MASCNFSSWTSLKVPECSFQLVWTDFDISVKYPQFLSGSSVTLSRVLAALSSTPSPWCDFQESTRRRRGSSWTAWPTVAGTRSRAVFTLHFPLLTLTPHWASDWKWWAAMAFWGMFVSSFPFKVKLLLFSNTPPHRNTPRTPQKHSFRV